jgi:ribosomal protein S18 acetylase RimI-like enzyme
MCTKPKYKNLGYASLMVDEFIKRVKTENTGRTVALRIIASALDTAVTFYEKYGFVWTKNSILDYPRLLCFEKYEENKEYFIMELVL